MEQDVNSRRSLILKVLFFSLVFLVILSSSMYIYSEYRNTKYVKECKLLLLEKEQQLNSTSDIVIPMIKKAIVIAQDDVYKKFLENTNNCSVMAFRYNNISRTIVDAECIYNIS